MHLPLDLALIKVLIIVISHNHMMNLFNIQPYCASLSLTCTKSYWILESNLSTSLAFLSHLPIKLSNLLVKNCMCSMISGSNELVEGDSSWDEVDSSTKGPFLLTTTSDFTTVTAEILPNIFIMGSTSLKGILAKLATLVIKPSKDKLDSLLEKSFWITSIKYEARSTGTLVVMAYMNCAFLAVSFICLRIGHKLVRIIFANSL